MEIGNEGVSRGRARALALLSASAVLAATPASAGDFYLSGGISIGNGHVDTGGVNTLGPSTTSNAGSDKDSSAFVAGAVGFSFPLGHVLPRRMPRWMPDLDLEDWGLRTEIEAGGARQYDLLAGPGTQTHFIQLSNTTLVLNTYLDLPLGHAIEAMMGRSRLLEPIVFSPGIGLGYGRTQIESTNNFATSDETYNDFMYQVSAELGYPLTDRVTVTAGYRYVRVGEFDNALTAPQPAGNLSLDVNTHELRTSVRVNFWSTRFPRGLFKSSRRRYEP